MSITLGKYGFHIVGRKTIGGPTGQPAFVVKDTKNEPYIDKNKHSHVAEALQYLMLHITAGGEGHLLARRKEVKGVSAAGWT